MVVRANYWASGTYSGGDVGAVLIGVYVRCRCEQDYEGDEIEHRLNARAY